MPRKRFGYNYDDSSSEDPEEENQDQLIYKTPQKKARQSQGKAAKKKSNTKKKKNANRWTWRIDTAQNLNILARSTSPSNHTITNFSSLATTTSTSDMQLSEGAKNRIDNFLKRIESDDESENYSENYIPPPPTRSSPSSVKPADFYSFPESEEELEESVENKSPYRSPDEGISLLTPSSPKPGTSGSITFVSNLHKPAEPAQDFDAYIASILTSSDESDLEEKPVELSLAELKKKTDDILKEVEQEVKLSIAAMHPKPDLQPDPTPDLKPPPLDREAPSCPVCLEKYDEELKHAMATLCGHIFCKNCIETVVGDSKKCPTCRRGLTKKKYHPVYI